MSFSQPVPSLPREICDEITDYLHADKNALKSCSLTCKGWLRRARYHLFSSFVVQRLDFPSIVDFLDSPSCQIALFIRHLSLRDISRTTTTTTGDCIIMRHLPFLMSLLPSVQTIRLWDFMFPSFSKTERFELLENFRDIKNLELVDITTNTLEELFEIICAFPALESFTLSPFQLWGQLEQRSNWKYPKLQSSSRLRVHILGHHPFSLPSIVQWLLSQNLDPILKSVQYDLGNAGNKRALQQLVCNVGQSLDCLQVVFPPHYLYIRHDETLVDSLDIRRCKSLRSLHMKNILLGFHYNSIAVINRSSVEILEQVESYEMRELLFTLEPNHQSDLIHILQEFDWDGVARNLSRPQFGNLERVVFQIPASPQLTEAKWIIKEEYLPAFKRILRFENCDIGHRY